MKKLFAFLVLVLLFSAKVFAQLPLPNPRSILKFSLSDGAPLTVVIDGRRWDRESTSLVVRDLPPGMHRIKVYRITTDEAYDNRPAPTLVYAGSVRLRPETFNICTIDVVRGSLALRVRPLNEDIPVEGNYGTAGPDRRGESDGHNNTYGGEPNNHGYDGPGNNAYGNADNRNYFTNRDMDDLRARADKLITDTDKENLLKTATESHSFSTAQTAQMLKMLSFESTKLDFAKWAYNHVSDRGNYWKLESEFGFSSSKEELNNYIRSQQ